MSSLNIPDPVDPLHEGVHQRLVELLEKERRSVRWLAHEMGMPYTTFIGQHNKRAYSLDAVAGAARALGVAVDWLLHGEQSGVIGRTLRPVSGAELERLRGLLVSALEIVDPTSLRDNEPPE